MSFEHPIKEMSFQFLTRGNILKGLIEKGEL